MICNLIGNLLSLNAYINILYCKNLQDYNIIINLKYKLSIMNNTSTRTRLEVTFKYWSLIFTYLVHKRRIEDILHDYNL